MLLRRCIQLPRSGPFLRSLASTYSGRSPLRLPIPTSSSVTPAGVSRRRLIRWAMPSGSSRRDRMSTQMNKETRRAAEVGDERWQEGNEDCRSSCFGFIGSSTARQMTRFAGFGVLAEYISASQDTAKNKLTAPASPLPPPYRPTSGLLF